MQASFHGRHVVVSGASGALGSAVVGALLRAGATCHLPARETDSFPVLAPELAERRKLARGVAVLDPASLESFYASLPPLWASVHCIGGFDMSPLAGTGAAELERMFAPNFTAPYLCTREAVTSMRRAGVGGRVVNVVARVALEPRGGAGMSAYAASKAALAAATVALGEELAPEGIFVNAIAPSLMDTPANRKSMPDADFTCWPSVDDVAAAIVWLASPENTLVRGSLIPVYGRS